MAFIDQSFPEQKQTPTSSVTSHQTLVKPSHKSEMKKAKQSK